MNQSAIVWFLVSMAAYGVGEYLSKKYSLAPSTSLFLWAVVFYAFTAAAWLPAIRIVQKLAVLGTVWAVAYAIVSVVIGVWMFEERLTAIHVAGIVLGIFATVLLSL